MPELPDVVVYIESLERRVLGATLERIRIASPFVLRSVEPPLVALEGRAVAGIRRLGKRIVLDFGDELFLAIHLMVAGRLRWRDPGARTPGRRGLAALDFPGGTVLFTEEGTKRRAWLRAVKGATSLAELDPGGLEVLDVGLEAFAERLRSESHTLKRALTDPHLFSGIGNAYSDEILHRAQLSPARLTRRLSDGDVQRLHEATRDTLREWIQRLREEVGDGFPEKVTAFREGMAVHGRYRQPCPRCGGAVQRIVYAENESNYCPTCQTEGRLLADRGLSRLLKRDWPRTLEELERRRSGARGNVPG
jgi:formamidopyrimidine-DNA glycosylase